MWPERHIRAVAASRERAGRARRAVKPLRYGDKRGRDPGNWEEDSPDATVPISRAKEAWVAFFRLIDLLVPRDLAVHVVLDTITAHCAQPSSKTSANSNVDKSS